MAQIRETHTVVEDVPVERRTVVEEDYPPVVYERRGLSGGAIAALVLAGVAVAVLITLLILNSQQRDQQAQIDDARARADAAQRAASQPQMPAPAQPAPPVVVLPQSPPTTVTVPAPATAPAPATSSSSPSSTSGVSVEVDVTTKLLDDPDLRTHPIDVKVNNGVATLSGDLPSADLRAKAEHIAASVKGVRRVVNKITVQGAS
ncbi:MAG TPA: BON domain-containing protein [Blastocatellia bacterium]|nr:BON domain-containing protein [Blastocatellia bacterium]